MLNLGQWMMKASAILELVQLEAPCASTLYRVGDRLYAPVSYTHLTLPTILRV